MIRLTIVRHAESQANLTQRTHIGGRVSSSPLTSKGVRQATLLGEYFARQQKERSGARLFDYVFVSPTVRTKATAGIICGHIGISEDELETRESLLELTHGEWDGQPRDVHHTPQVLDNMTRLGWDWKSPTGGESLREVGARMMTFIDSLSSLENVANKDTIDVLAVSHSIAIRTLLNSLLDCEENLVRRHGLENTGVSEFWKYPEGWSLQKWNHCAHLIGEGKQGLKL